MEPNVGGLDRTLRIVVGIVLLSLVDLLPAPACWFGLIGVVPLATGLMRRCPLYSLFGWRTCTT